MNNFDTIRPEELEENYTLDGIYPEVVSYEILSQELAAKLHEQTFINKIMTYFDTLHS